MKIINDNEFRSLHFPTIDNGKIESGASDIEKHWKSMWNPYSTFKIMKPQDPFDMPENFKHEFLFVFWEEICLESSDLKKNKKLLALKPIDEVLTASTEAFCICLMLNNVSSWLHKTIQNEEKKLKDNGEESTNETKKELFKKLCEVIGEKNNHLDKHFTGSNATKGVSNCIGGWSRNGVELYSHLCYTITRFRKDEKFGVMKSLFQDEMKKKYGKVEKKGKGDNSKYIFGKVHWCYVSTNTY